MRSDARASRSPGEAIPSGVSKSKKPTLPKERVEKIVESAMGTDEEFLIRPRHEGG